MEIPPKPSKNAHTTIFIEIIFIGIFETIETPFVSSTIPDKMPVAKEDGRCKKDNIGDNIKDKNLNAPVLFNIEIITLKSMTNPPIIIIVFIEDMILFCKILPKLFNLGGIFFTLPFILL